MAAVPPKSSSFTTPQFFYQKANQLGREAVYAAPKATATALAIAPFALHLFQPEGILTQMLTLGLTTGVVLNAPHIYDYVYNHPLTAKVCKQPIVQQIAKHSVVKEGTAMASSVIHDVSKFAAKVKDQAASFLPEVEEAPTYDEAYQEGGMELKRARPERNTPPATSSLTSHLDKLKQAFKAVPAATVATLVVNAFALRFFQPEGLITQFFTLTAASGSFFTATKLYGRHHTHPLVQALANHPTVVKGTTFASLITDTASAFYAHVRAFPATPGAAAQTQAGRRQSDGKYPTFDEFRQSLASENEDNWTGIILASGVTVPEDQLKSMYNEVVHFLKIEENGLQEEARSLRSKLRGGVPSTDGSRSATLRRKTSATNPRDR